MDPTSSKPRTILDGALPFSPKALPRSSPRSVGQAAFDPDRDGEPPLAVPEATRAHVTKHVAKHQALRHLVTAIRAIERRGRDAAPDRAPSHAWSGGGHAPWQLGVAEIDRRLGPGGIEPGALHEIKPAMAVGTAACDGDGIDGWASGFTAALAFALALSLRRRGSGSAAGSRSEQGGQLHHPTSHPGALLWCWPTALAHELGGLHAPGLTDLGLDPAGLIVAAPDKVADVLWAMEEGLKSPGLDLVVGVLREAGLTSARRLALAAAAHGIPCLMVTDPHTPAAAATATRWRIGRAVSAPHPFAHRLDEALPGAPRYRVTLERSRAAGLAGPAAPLLLEWLDATHCFRLAPPSADRADEAVRSRRHRR